VVLIGLVMLEEKICETDCKVNGRQVMVQTHLDLKIRSVPILSANLNFYKLSDIFHVMFKMVILILPFTGDQMIKLSMMFEVINY